MAIDNSNLNVNQVNITQSSTSTTYLYFLQRTHKRKQGCNHGLSNQTTTLPGIPSTLLHWQRHWLGPQTRRCPRCSYHQAPLRVHVGCSKDFECGVSCACQDTQSMPLPVTQLSIPRYVMANVMTDTPSRSSPSRGGQIYTRKFCHLDPSGRGNSAPISQGTTSHRTKGQCPLRHTSCAFSGSQVGCTSARTRRGEYFRHD